MKVIFVVLVLLPLAAIATDSEQVDSSRIKRSGFSFLSSLQKNLFSASASLSSGSSGSSSGSPGHDYGSSGHDTKGFDGWQLKKSILNTLFQAVKAITGGVTSLGGQLIKGSGYVVSAKGKLIQSSGDAVSGVGQQIIKSAQLVPPHHGYHSGHSSGPSGSAAFFAKLSGGSSGSSSGSTHDSHSSHESYTSYGGPTGYSYTAPGSISYSEVKTPSYTGSYDIPKSPVTYGTPISSYGTDHKSSHDPSIILQEILKTLPHKPSKVVESHHKVKQYEIPTDPIPPFRPIKSGPIPHANYGPPVEISHTHTLTTAYGTPSVDQYHKYFEQRSDGSEPVPNVTTQDKKTDVDQLDKHGSIYHKMTLKAKKHAVIETNTFGLKKKSTDIAKDVVKQFLGKNPSYEIQKSVEYEINDSDLNKKP